MANILNSSHLVSFLVLETSLSVYSKTVLILSFRVFRLSQLVFPLSIITSIVACGLCFCTALGDDYLIFSLFFHLGILA